MVVRKCCKCGHLSKIIFPCAKCKINICQKCYNKSTGLCLDCEVDIWNIKYREKIKLYENGIATI